MEISQSFVGKLKSFFKSENNKKARLLIAGTDLKFIRPAIKYLEEHFEIETDDFSGRLNENPIREESKELLKWADIVFCEWMESYTVWYSNNIGKNQKLFIRAHKYEIAKLHGYNVNFDNVDGVITINYFLLELFSNMFSIPREKMFYLNNIIETSIYSSEKQGDYLHNLALVGSVPRLKGYKRALELLKKLKQIDDKFQLQVFGKTKKDLKWMNTPIENEYFDDCDRFIEENDLEDSIIYNGWVERGEMFNNIGFVLSLSDLEGSHLSPTEAFQASTLSVLRKWPGISYIYPEHLIFDDIDEMAEFILNLSKDEDEYKRLAAPLRKYCHDSFGEEYFVNNLIRIFNSKTKSKTLPISLIEFEKNYLDENNNVLTDKLLNDFENSYIVNNKDEIEKIVSKNEKASIFLSNEIDVFEIKDYYETYKDENTLIYSIYFLEHIDEARQFAEAISEFQKDENIEIK